MIAEGATRSNSYEQILDKLFPLAAGYSASASVEMTVISGRVHKDNLDRFYPLLIESIREPAFKQEDLDRIKSQTLNYLENALRYSSDEELGKAVLYNAMFAGTPYGHLAGRNDRRRARHHHRRRERFLRRTLHPRERGDRARRRIRLLRRWKTCARDLAALPAGSPDRCPAAQAGADPRPAGDDRRKGLRRHGHQHRAFPSTCSVARRSGTPWPWPTPGSASIATRAAICTR